MARLPMIFYPQEVENPTEMLNKLKGLETVLEGLEAQTRGK